MRHTSTHVLLASLLGASLLGIASAGAAASSPAVSMSNEGVRFAAPMALDQTRLMAMKPGDVVEVPFPVIGTRKVVFEGIVQGADGVRYWQGSLAGSPLDRVVLKQQGKGFVGMIRYGKTQLAFRAQDHKLVPASAASLTPASGRVYSLVPTTGAKSGYTAIQMNTAALAQTPVGGELSLPLPNGQTEVAIVTQSGVDEDGFYQVQAVSRLNGRAYPSVLTVSTEAVFGTVVTPEGEYQIITRDGKTQVFDARSAGLSEPRGQDHVPVSAAALLSKTTTVAAATSTTGTTTSSLTPLAAGTVDTTITLLMTYSSSFVTLWGTETTARTRLSNLVQVANSAYSNSGTGVQFKVVGWKLLGQADTTPQNNLTQMYGAKGVFSVIPALKKSTGAAIAVFYAPFNTATSSTSTCGVAYVPASGSGGLSVYARQVASLGLAALNDGQMANGYYCSPLSFPHELGHTLGAMHDVANSSTTGVFSYSYGKGISGQFGTVMSYISPRVALFSSPQLTCTSSGTACGSSTENVVATVLQTKSYMAATGNTAAASVASSSAVSASGWILNSNGTAFTGSATVKAQTSGVTCTFGKTGLYVCTVPASTASVSVQPTVTNKVVTPTVGTFSMSTLSSTPVIGTTFYVK